MEELELYELYYLIMLDDIHDGSSIISYNMESIWEEVKRRYYEENKILLNIYSPKDCNILFYWLRDNCRYRLLNYLMSKMVNRFTTLDETSNEKSDNRDEFFLNNLKLIYNILNVQARRIISNINVEDIPLPKSSKENTISIVKDILMEIDNNGDWLDVYENIINDNRIIYLNEISEEEEEKLKQSLGISTLKHIDNSYLQFGNDKAYLLLRYYGNIGDVAPTIHEIIHYIIRNAHRAQTEAPILREFPSIFYELYSIDYLGKLGYDKKVLEAINYVRLVDSYLSLKEMNNMLFYLNLMVNNNEINMENDKVQYAEIYSDMDQILKEIVYDKNNDYIKRCDDVTTDLITNPYLFFQIYPYVIDNYLADQAMNKIKEDKTLYSMIKYMTENLTNTNASDVFSLLADSSLLVEGNEKVKKRVK